jgi:hypothetical protein
LRGDDFIRLKIDLDKIKIRIKKYRQESHCKITAKERAHTGLSSSLNSRIVCYFVVGIYSI